MSVEAVQSPQRAGGESMTQEIFSVALLEALPGKGEELAAVLREFYSMMRAKGYSSDWLYRDNDRPDHFVHVRRWKSPELRSEAQHDPEVHRYWQQLPELCTIPTVYENLETLFAG
jgi:quinol monooxygenase YgiN